MTPAPDAPAPARRRIGPTQQIFLGLVAGCAAGWASSRLEDGARATLDQAFALLRDIFLHLVKVLIAPLIFGTVVQGIAGMGDLRRIGRLAAKSFGYFLAVTTLALGVGFLVVNLFHPGAGVPLAGSVSALGAAAAARPLSAWEFVLQVFPVSIVDALAGNNVLQIVAFSLLFAVAVALAGDAGRPIVALCESLTQVMFRFAELVMAFAPVGVGAAIAFTVSHQGLGMLASLGRLVLTLYAGLALFVLVVLGGIIALARVPLRPFLRAIREPLAVAFATANSEAVLADLLARLERFGVPRGVAGFVLPTGYTFNLEGTTLHLAVASVFVAQVAETAGGAPFGLDRQFALFLTLVLATKGLAAVPRVSIVVLVATLHAFGLPPEGAAMILGVEVLQDMARTTVNVFGNSLAAVVVAKWEGVFDEAKARANFGPPAAL
jgi:proton glutamate symport protein